MGRNLDPVCKLCRREGVKLYLKGARCDTNKCAISRRNVAPGMHGYRRSKLSEYGLRLREKQKLKRFYGVLEKQFRRYYGIATRSKQSTGEELLSMMERRLDNVVHRLGFAQSRAAGRQLVSHGHVQVNGRTCDIPSRILKVGDTIRVRSRTNSLNMVKLSLSSPLQPMPDFLDLVENDPPEGRLSRIPSRGDVDPRIAEIREQLIIEVCSR